MRGQNNQASKKTFLASEESYRVTRLQQKCMERHMDVRKIYRRPSLGFPADIWLCEIESVLCVKVGHCRILSSPGYTKTFHRQRHIMSTPLEADREEKAEKLKEVTTEVFASSDICISSEYKYERC